MLQSFSQSPDWLYSEPLLFDDEFCQSLMKDLQSLPTPPQSPPMKAGMGGSKPLSKEDQLSYVSDILLEDHDMQQLNWNYDFFHSDAAEKDCEPSQPCSPLEESGEDCLWRCLASDKSLEEKLVSTMLGSSPLLSDINTSIFEEIAGSTLDCQNLMNTPESSEATSDYGSTGGELSTYSSSDSGELRPRLSLMFLTSAFHLTCCVIVHLISINTPRPEPLRFIDNRLLMFSGTEPGPFFALCLSWWPGRPPVIPPEIVKEAWAGFELTDRSKREVSGGRIDCEGV